MEKKASNTLLIKKVLIVFFSLIGIFLTVKLSIIYYDSNFNPYALPSFCSVSDIIDCDGVAQTTHSQFLGIPLSYWGMFLYFFVIFLVFVENLKNIKFLKFLEVFKNPLSYITTLGLIAFLVSIILACVSIYEIKKICVLCFCTYFLNLLIAMIATDTKQSLFKSFKDSVIDFIDALKIKKYLISFLCLMLIGVGTLTYTSLSYCFAPQVKRVKEFKAYQKMQEDNPFKVQGNILGDKDAKLLVYIYTDYQCPICRTYNVITHRAASELSGFKIIHKNFPLDSNCNKYVPFSMHENSCLLAKYSIAAEEQGRFWDLNSELFETQPKNEEEILKLTKSMGFNNVKLKKDAHSEKTSEILSKDIEDAINLKVDGTPTIIINGKVHTGIKPYYELKEMLIKNGAKKKR